MAEEAGNSMSENDTETSETAEVERSFTPADVERIVKDRLARHKAAPPADYDDLKARAAKLDEIEEKNKSELEKAVTRAETAEKERANVLAEANEIKLRSAILSEAAKPERHVVDTDSAIALLDRSTLELDDNGNPTNIAEAMDSLLTAKPFLVAAGGSRGNADQGARGITANQLSQADLSKMSPEAIVKAQAEGRLDSLLQGQT